MCLYYALDGMKRVGRECRAVMIDRRQMAQDSDSAFVPEIKPPCVNQNRCSCVPL